MDRSGAWQLSPAFDVAYSYNPNGLWTSKHQMSINGKRDDFIVSDFLSAAEQTGLPKQRIRKCIDEVLTVLPLWANCAQAAGVSGEMIEAIGKTFRRFDI